MATCTVCQLHAESTFKVEGMDCRDEVALIERRFRNLVGVEDFSADVIGQRLHVRYDAAKLSTAGIADAVADTGLHAWLEHEPPVAHAAAPSYRRPALVVTSGVAFGLALLGESFTFSFVNATALYAAAIVLSAPLTLPKAMHALRVGALDINVLMLVAAAGAVALGQWSEAAAVTFLFALAQALEVYTLERARRAVRSLLDLAPPTVTLRDGAGERQVVAELVPVGATILIRPGEGVALDGLVLAGESAVNQGPVTGESMPVDKGPGSELFAGSTNGYGVLEIRVTRLRRDTRLARIIHLVERAQSQRAPSQTLVERFARIYTPTVLFLAAGLAVLPPLVLGAEWPTWIYRALVLLVVSCPCALVISTPVSVVAALAGAARHGVLIKGGSHLERAGGVKAVAFDKTGTLTRGRPDVVSVHPLADLSVSDVVALAAAVEQRSEHPLAGAVVRYAEQLGLSITPAARVQATAGRGVSGSVDHANVLVGNHRWFEERHLCSEALHAHLDLLTVAGHTPVIVARENVPVGVIAIADRARDESRAAIERLRRDGITAVVLLTGDGTVPAGALARSVGIDDVRAELLPEDKVREVEALKQRYGLLAMVGDGINDAPALASADVGIAMGVAGSATAIEAADIALMGDDIRRVPYVLSLGRATVRSIRVNFAIALILKLAFVVAAATGVATLWMAVLADTGASVLVVANALRLLRAD